MIFFLVGSRLFTPPECFKLECTTKGINGFKRDVWSLGCVLYCLLNGKVPFYGDNLKELLKSIDEESQCLKFVHKDVSSKTKGLIMGMLRINPNQRLSIKEIRKELDELIRKHF